MAFTSQVQSKPTTVLFRLKAASQVSGQCCTRSPAADRTQLRTTLGLRFCLPRPTGIRTKAGETHHFFLPMRNFFFMKTIYLRGTQTSRAVEVT